MKRNSREFFKGKNITLLRKKSHFSWPIHGHDYYELILYRGCQGECTINGIRYPIHENSLFLLTPFDFHEITATHTQGALSYVLSFTEDAVESELLLPLSLSALIYHDPPSYVETALDDLLGTLKAPKKPPYFDVYSKSLLNGILAKVLQGATRVTEGESGGSPIINRAMLFTMLSYNQELSLSSIAKRCHITPSYFSTLFHNQVGKTFTEYLNEIRIAQAKRLLRTSSDTVLKIMSQCGYNTPSHFIKCFRERTGMTPTQYRMNKYVK